MSIAMQRLEGRLFPGRLSQLYSFPITLKRRNSLTDLCERSTAARGGLQSYAKYPSNILFGEMQFAP